MAILENYNIEVEDSTLGELYPTKKAMNDDIQGIVNRGYCQPKEQYVFSADYIAKPQFIEHQEIGIFGETSSKVYNTIFKTMYETNKIRHNFCLIKAPDASVSYVSTNHRVWSYPLNPVNTAEYDETLAPNNISSLDDAQFIKSFNFNECVYNPFFTYAKITDGIIDLNYSETDDNELFRTLTGATSIKDRDDIYVSSIRLRSAVWDKLTNSWDYTTQILPMIYGFNEVNCLQMFTGMFSEFTYSIYTNRATESTGVIQDANLTALKTHYYDYYEGTTRRTYASRLKFGNSMPEITFTPDLEYVNGKTQILYENPDFVFVAIQTSQTSTYINYTFKKLYKIGYVYKKLAELGLYFSGNKGVVVGSVVKYLEGLTPETLMNRDDTYLGEMLEGGLTTGNFLRGAEIADSKSPNKTGSNVDINYKPSFDVSNDDIIDNFQYGTQTSLNINQFVSSYVLDGVDLQKLSNEFKNPTNEIPSGDTPFENIISLKKYPFNVLNHTITFEPSNIILSKWDTNVSAPKINATQTLINIGSFTIDRKYNNFLDYEPYTSCELYLPFADYVPINLNKCMGSTIDIKMIWDIDGNIKYLILCEDLLLSEINTNIASSQILTAINSGLKSLQDVQNVFTIASGVTGMVGSAISGNVFGVVSSYVGTISGVVNAVTNQNQNYTTQKGQPQSDVSQKTILDFILHITRPIVKIPKNYASTIGHILNETKVLSELSGFTVCDNVIINNINCLNNEKAEIKNLLETGVIL